MKTCLERAVRYSRYPGKTDCEQTAQFIFGQVQGAVHLVLLADDETKAMAMARLDIEAAFHFLQIVEPYHVRAPALSKAPPIV